MFYYFILIFNKDMFLFKKNMSQRYKSVSIPANDREEEYNETLEKLLTNGYQTTPYSLLHNLYPFVNDTRYIGIYKNESDDKQYPLINNTTRDLEFSQDNSETIASEITKLVISSNLNLSNSATNNTTKPKAIIIKNKKTQNKTEELLNNINIPSDSNLAKLTMFLAEQIDNTGGYGLNLNSTYNAGTSMPACSRADRMGTCFASLGMLLGRTRDEGLNAPWNKFMNYTSTAVVKDDNNILWKSKIENNKGNNPTEDTAREQWDRGIINHELYNQRFNIWEVEMAEGSPIIKLTSTGDFVNYPLTEQQLVNGLEISFLPTQDGSGYSAGSSYTITIDGVDKKLFEDIDETKAGSGANIIENQLLKIYYNSSADEGNGAFFILKTGGGEGAGGGKKIGDVFWSDHIIDSEAMGVQRCLLANGQDISTKMGDYPDFIAYLKDLKTAQPTQFTATLEDWKEIEKSSIWHLETSLGDITRLGQVNKYYFFDGLEYAWKGLDGYNYYTEQTTISNGFVRLYDNAHNYIKEAYKMTNAFIENYNKLTEAKKGNIVENEKEEKDGFEYSNFSASNYLNLPFKFDPTRPFEVCCSFLPKNLSTRQTFLLLNSNLYNAGYGALGFQADGSTMRILMDEDSYNWDVYDKTFPGVVGQKYWFKATYDGTSTYEGLYSTDGVNWTSLGAITSSKKLYTLSDNQMVGTNTGNWICNGSIFIDKDFYVKYTDTNTYAFQLNTLTRDKDNDITGLEQICKLKCIYDTTGLTGEDEDGTIQQQELPNTTTGGTFSNNTGTYAGYVRQEATRGYYYIQAIGEKNETPKTFKFKSVVNTYADLPESAENGDIYYVLTGDDEHPKGNYAFGDDNNWYFVGDERYFVENPFSYGFLMKCKNNTISNPCWLKSDGKVKEGATYTGFYAYLLDIWNNGEETTYTDIGGNEYTGKLKNGAIVLNHSDWGTIYNNYGIVNCFGINTTNQQFYLPYGEENKRILIEKKEATDTDGSWYNLYSDGWYEEGFLYYKGSSVAGTTTITFKKEFKDTNYYFNGNAVYSSASTTHNSVLEIYTSRTTTSTSFYIAGAFFGYQLEVKGYVNTSEITDINYYNYYYVGNVIQNQSAIDIANVLTELENIKKKAKIKIKSNYTGDVKYEVFNDGMCRQWGTILYTSGNKFDISLAIEYLDTSYNIQALSAVDNDTASSGTTNALTILNKTKTTTGVSINVYGSYMYSMDWMTYGKVDLTKLRIEL